MSDDRSSRRVLVLAAEPVPGEPVLDELNRHADGAEESSVLVVAPALTDSALKHAMGDVDEGHARAERVLAASLDELKRSGVIADGRVGDADPVLAVEDAVAEFPADAVIVVTAPEGEGPYLEDEAFDRLRAQLDREVIHVTVSRPDTRGADVEAVERAAGDGRERADEIDPDSKNLPSLSLSDLLGIVVAVVGTIVLVVLAAQCGGDEVQRNPGTGGVGSEGSCVFRYVVAGAMALANIAHVVGLLLFESVGYRGLGARAFAMLSLIGTPVAIIAVLLVD